MTNHVPTLETCQKLKAAGFPQETNFLWARDRIMYIDDWGMLVAMRTTQDMPDYWAAPLLTEILEQLPQEIVMYKPIRPTDKYKFVYEAKMKASPGIPNAAESTALLWLELNGEKS